MRTETGGPTSGPVLGFEFYPIRLLIELSILKYLRNHQVHLHASLGLSPCAGEGLQSPPTSPPVPSVHGGLPTAATDISSGVAAAQSVCGLRSGFASRPDPFQLYGCRARSSGGCSSPRNCLVLPQIQPFFQLLPSAGCPAPHLFRVSRWTSLRGVRAANNHAASGLAAPVFSLQWNLH